MVCHSETIEIIQQRLLVLQETAKRSVLNLFLKMAVTYLSKSESSPSRFVKSRPRPLSSSNSTQASARSAVIYRAGLDALLDTTVAFPATSVISYRLTVPSPTMISASPVMTLVANISMSMGPTGIGPHPLLLSVQLAVLPERRLNPVLTSSEQYIPLTMLNEMCGLLCLCNWY